MRMTPQTIAATLALFDGDADEATVSHVSWRCVRTPTGALPSITGAGAVLLL